MSVIEWDQLQQLIVLDIDNFEKPLQDFKKHIDKFQEKPELLEPVLPKLISHLTEYTNKPVIFKYLYHIIKTIGFKSVGKHFPHETNKLPLIVDLLSKEDPNNREDWQTRYVLTVWLSILILTPFDLVKFDAGQTDKTDDSLERKIYSALSRSLSNHDSCQHMTAYCLAKFYSRPDILSNSRALDEFIGLSLEELQLLKTSTQDPRGLALDEVKLIGHLRTLAYVYKFLPRGELQTRSSKLLALLGELELEKVHSESVNHLLIKLIQRIGLSLLPKKLATWRHKRGARILGIHQHKEILERSQNTIPLSKDARSPSAPSGGESELQCGQIGLDKEDQILLQSSSGWLETILSMLFVAAQNGQTKIRWSAAKGIARLASRLDRARAGEIIQMVLGNFFDLSATSNEFAWHGGCLALAEMARQGLILEEKLNEVMQIISEAIIYDKIKGSFAVGAHVRESACYIIWAMARTYDDHHLRAHISRLSINLMCSIVFDRELQCRRAAAAAFQELIGRQGAFDNKLVSLLDLADYQNIGVRQFAYMDVANQVSKIAGPEYYEPLIEHLLDKKLAHWDIEIRRLASQSLGSMMIHPEVNYIEKMVLPKLISGSEQSTDLNLKHGSMLALSRVMFTLVFPKQYNFEAGIGATSFEHIIANITASCDQQLKSKQHANLFLEALCQLIPITMWAKLKLSCDSATIEQWEKLVWTALANDKSELRELASKAYLALYCYYYSSNKSCQDRLLTQANRSLAHPNEPLRCGALKSLAKLGETLSLEHAVAAMSQTGDKIRRDSDTADIILMSLCSYLSGNTRQLSTDQVFAQAKVECCQAFVEFVCLLDAKTIIISTNWLTAGLDALIANTEDYTFDKRGDIGVQVRKAAVKGLQELCSYLISTQKGYPVLYESDRIQKITMKILQQCLSYNNSARQVASQCFYKLMQSIEQQRIYDDSRYGRLADLVPHFPEILGLFAKFQASDVPEDNFLWRDDSTPIFVQLLTKPEYSTDLWLGLIPALGQASELCAKQFRDSLTDYIRKDLLCEDDDDDDDDDDDGKDKSCNIADKEQRRQLYQQLFESFLYTLESATTNRSKALGTESTASPANNAQAKLALTLEHQHQQRTLNAGLQTCDFMLTQGLMSETSSDYQQRLMEFCARAASFSSASPYKTLSKDPKRLLAVSRVLCSMLQLSVQIRPKCLELCLSLLANGFAAVRVYTAEQLYSSIMVQQMDEQYEDESELDQQKQQSLDEAMELLSKTQWKQPLEEVKPIKEQVELSLKEFYSTSD